MSMNCPHLFICVCWEVWCVELVGCGSSLAIASSGKNSGCHSACWNRVCSVCHLLCTNEEWGQQQQTPAWDGSRASLAPMRCKSPPVPCLQFTNNMILFSLVPSHLGALTCLHGIHCRNKVDGALLFSILKFWVSLTSQQCSQIGGRAPVTAQAQNYPDLFTQR